MTEAGERHTTSAAADCDETVRLLYQFIDGELTEELRIVFTSHLDSCPPCLKIVSFERDLRVVIADRCQERVPDELRDRISAALNDEAARTKRR